MANGITVDTDLHQDLLTIMEEHTPAIHQEFPEGSFKRLFWDQQREALKVGARQMRWHPTVIKWCLNIKLRSSAAYEAIRQSGFIALPSSRTLRDYTHIHKSSTGFQPEVAEQLMKEAKVDDKDLYKRHVALLFDEVRIKDNLVYDKHSFRMIGFVDIGDVNNELLAFEQVCEGEVANSGLRLQVAKYMLVFMVRGLFVNLEFPFAQFATRNTSADLLFPMVWEAVQKLEIAGFNVIAITCDGASFNRKFFRMHKKSSEDFVYKTINPYADDNRHVYFFSDVPHLIKTVRNCMSNSFSHSNSRALWVST